MSSDTHQRLLDEAELKQVSGGQISFSLLGTNYTLNGNQLTVMNGTMTTTRTLTPAQAGDLTNVYNAVQAGTAATLSAADAILSDLRAIGF